jgi:hypothetical protein
MMLPRARVELVDALTLRVDVDLVASSLDTALQNVRDAKLTRQRISKASGVNS